MTRYIIRDYLSAFRPGHMGQDRAGYAAAFWMVYYSLITILIQRKDAVFGWMEAAVQVALLLPMLFVWCSVMTHPPRPAKMMYLCPMDEGERRRYIRASYGFRVCVHMLVCMLGLGIVVPFSHCDIYSVLLILANDFTIAILVCHGGGNTGGTAAETEGAPKAQKGQAAGRGNGCTTKGYFMFAIALVSNLIQCGILADDAPDMGVKLALALFFGVVQAPLGFRYGKDIRKELEEAAAYEDVPDRRAGG